MGGSVSMIDGHIDEVLKPCPFCGGKAIVNRRTNRYVDWWLVSCPKCHITQAGSEHESSFEAIEAWNRRADT